MSNWAAGILTAAGRALQAKVEAQQANLYLTKIKLGDGTETMADVDDLTDLVSAKATLPISSASAAGSVATITGIISSSDNTTGFYVREWGLFANDPDSGEILYMITIDSQAEWLPPSTESAIVTATYGLHVAIANSTNIVAEIDPTGLVDVDMLNKYTHALQRNTAYNLGDDVTSPALKHGLFLECTTSGTSAVSLLTNLPTLDEGATITDGTVEWTIRKIASQNWVKNLLRANPELAVTPSNITIAGVGNTQTVNVSYKGGGILSVSSSDETIATATIDGTAVTITNIAEGNAQIEISLSETDANYGASVYVQVETLDVIDPELTLSSYDVVVSGANATGSVTLTTKSDGAITVISNNPNVATATLTGNTINIVGVDNGTTTITVQQAATSLYIPAEAVINLQVTASQDPNLTLSTSSVVVYTGGSAQVTASYSGGGTLSVTSSNNSVATASINGTTITITEQANGKATITVSVAASATHYETSKTISVTAYHVSAVLNNNSPADIQRIAKAGVASSIWSVGDWVSMTLDETDIGVGGTTRTIKGTYRAYILGFNHNAEYEGPTSIHFALGRNAAGEEITFCASNYFTQNGTGLVMNTTNTAVGGWRDSVMRNTIAPQMKQVIPSNWFTKLDYCTKYTYDNTGTLQQTSDVMWLLSRYEIFNAPSDSKQEQYEYYKNGNGKLRKNELTGKNALWWLRSVDGSANFQDIGGNGVWSSSPASLSAGVTFCFAVGL